MTTSANRDTREYRCANCGGVFSYVEDGTWAEEDAIAEQKECFPDVPFEACVEVCDACFRQICINLN